jgi:predicted ATPase
LSAEEQRLFRRLAIFTGGCTLDAVAACTTANDQVVDVLEVVASLLDKTMLIQMELEGEEPRLSQLATLREFGLEQLASTGELEATCRAHATYYLHLAESVALHQFDAEQGLWLDRLERDHENLRAAFDWLLGQEELETASRLGIALWPFWWIHGHLSEGREALERILVAPASLP